MLFIPPMSLCVLAIKSNREPNPFVFCLVLSLFACLFLFLSLSSSPSQTLNETVSELRASFEQANAHILTTHQGDFNWLAKRVQATNQQIADITTLLNASLSDTQQTLANLTATHTADISALRETTSYLNASLTREQQWVSGLEVDVKDGKGKLAKIKKQCFAADLLGGGARTTTMARALDGNTLANGKEPGKGTVVSEDECGAADGAMTVGACATVSVFCIVALWLAGVN